ncbi:raffinose synthase isoform B [Chlorella sorokiniana]|uniref:galactinol--sucrose galactosyltransferase n=1 Tax=Chlorella sorokiniana TaxID=3076 RepID=A0A2P6THE8_CHLSO|nr:raffinose synthase isoform B [Chlorella sorokiniana]|eukprot:PRW33710.1 raffinose synthase isoform B [Chlorella sorokiniana]
MPPDPPAAPWAASPALPLHVESGSLLAGGPQGAPLLAGLDPCVSVRPGEGQSLVLGLACPGSPAALADCPLGQLRCRRFLALPKTSLYWMSPRWGSTAQQVPPTYALLLPLIDSGRFRATLRPPRTYSERGCLVLRVESGSPSVTAETWPSALLVAAGCDPFELCQRAVRAAARLSGSARPRADKEVPPSVDVFGWCTWDAFYSMVSAAGIAEGLKSLQSGGTPPRLLIIDDGWQVTEVDSPYRQIAAQRHIVGQVSVPHTLSEVEVEDAAVDLLLGPADERDTNTRHAVNAEEELILGFTPRALTPRQAAAANPFGRSPPWTASLYSPRGGAKGEAASSAAVTPAAPSPTHLPPSPLQRAAAAEPAAPPGGSLVRPPAWLAPIVPKLGLGAGAAGPEEITPEGEQPGGAVSEHSAAAAAAVAAAAETELAGAMQAGALQTLYSTLWSRFQHYEARALKMLKAWLDEAPSDSWRFRAFASAATGPLLRPTLLRFYAQSSEHTRRLASVQANAKFASAAAGPDTGDLNTLGPEGGLAGVVAHLKQRFGLRYVWMWHAMMGFWAGVAPPSEAPGMTKYGARVVRPQPTPSTLEIDPSYAWVQATLGGLGLPQSPAELHRDMHAYLKSCGADGVKVDVQGMVSLAGSATDVGGPALASAFHASLEDSAAAHFSGNSVINCMCGSTEDMYNMRDTNLARISDDFYPRNRASYTTHISTCAFNSLFAGELVIPDWDMFHSRHSAARMHAIARVISGGPLYISDKPGQHDFELLRRLVLPDGSVLRCLLPGRPTADCLFCDVNHDGRSALKVWNVNRCSAVVAAFNTQGASWSTPRRGFAFHDPNPPEVTAHVHAADVPWDLLPGGSGSGSGGGSGGSGASPAGGISKFAVYIESTQALHSVAWAFEPLAVRLAGGGGSELLTIAPCQEHGGMLVAPIGLTNMLNAGGAVLSCGWDGTEEPASQESGLFGSPAGSAGAPGASPAEQIAAAAGPSPLLRFSLSTRGPGRLLVYASAAPSAVEAAGGSVRFDYNGATGALSFDVPHGMAGCTDWQLLF